MVLAELERRCPDIYDRAVKRTWDCPVQGGCSLRRPDLLLDFGTWAVGVEVDERYHEAMPCWDEESRLNVIAADLQVPVAVLRLKVDTPVACFGTQHRSNGEPVLFAKPPFDVLMERAEAWLRATFQRFGGDVPPPPVAFLDEVGAAEDSSSSDEPRSSSENARPGTD